MFIKKIILDGFKSYGKRVEINGFDASFNAITGFNGSGKSNILDAICFVLGLHKLDMARCHSLNDLIYKNGHAGVTVASVTIEIDNSDGKFFQSDYKNSTTIVVRREINLKNQSKFYIDGFCVTKEKLLDFFQSVSLNIQNPHFLIMQGKIIKVVSMKPIEILSMIEEAVGVSVYENKKKQNMAKIEKYDASLNEINYIIEESIIPKLNQLKEEEKSLVEYRNVTAEFDINTKIYTAYRYLKDKDIVNNADNIIQTKNDFINNKTTENQKISEEYDSVYKEMEILQDKLNEEIGGDLKKLENDLNDKRTDFERINTNKKLKMDTLKEEQDKINNMNKTYDKDKKNLVNKRKDFDSANEKLEKLKQENVENENKLKTAEKEFEAIMFGLSKGRDGEEAATLVQQVMNAKDELAEIESNINRSKLVIKHNKSELTQKKQKVKSDKDTYERSNRDIEIKTKEIEAIQKELDNIDFNEERFDEIKVKLSQDKKDSRLLSDKLYQLQTEVPGSKFNYTKPYANFDSNDVIGVVCNLFTVNSNEHALALEKVCGGRLYNVVVSNEEVGKALINKGHLKERRTFLPLNKIRGRDTDLKALRIAERLVGKGNVNYAINLVSFDPALKNAMKHVFGDTLVCPNMDMAKKVAFAEGVMKRTVTYDGEIFDPSGTLTGGALRNGPQSLIIIGEMKDLKDKLSKLQVEIQQIEEEFQRLNKLSRQYFEKKSKFDLKNREIELLDQRLKESSHYVLIKEIEDMDQLLKNEEDNIHKYEEAKKLITKHIVDLEDKINNAESIRQREKKEAKEALESTRKLLEMSSKKLHKEEQNFECLTQEIKHHEETLENMQTQLEKLKMDVDKINAEILELNNQIKFASEEIAISEEKYSDYKKTLNAKSNEIKKFQKSLNSLKSKLEDNECQIKVKQHEVEKIQISIKEAKNGLKSMLSKNSWIKEEEKFFESPDSEYRILQENFNEEEFLNKLASLKSKKATLSKTVNMKANIMQGEKQKEFDELLKKREITFQDRKKLLKYIERVEKEKDVELRKAWEKINVNFGSIFSTLLPNSNAKLAPVKNKSIKEGLEIKVAFGEVWKESLSELSGGQRSLVALSLVLALLKYNPAPLYILDEIDAALDQSHTQNIGIMIRKHFKDAQFIIVSLKDDMFSNANVLFQTKFIDGYSTVERIKRSN